MADNENSENYILAEAIGILSNWDISIDRRLRILDISNQSESAHKERTTKAFLLTEIDKVLSQIFDNPENAHAFMNLPNHNDYFKGCTPIEIIEGGNIEVTQEVYTRIRALLSPW